MKLQFKAISLTLGLVALLGTANAVKSGTPSTELPNPTNSIELPDSSDVINSDSIKLETPETEATEEPTTDSAEVETPELEATEEPTTDSAEVETPELEATEEPTTDSAEVETPELEATEEPTTDSENAGIENPLPIEGSGIVVPDADTDLPVEQVK
jgi:hypothetical protein